MNDIEKLNSVKFNIRKALESQGSNITANTPFEEYPRYVMGMSGGGGGSGLPSTTYYIMRFEPITESAADVLFYRPGEESAAIFATVSVEHDAESGGSSFMGFSDIRPNEEAVPPVSENDILALSLKLACWDKNDEASGEAWEQVMSSSLEFYVYPYIL